MLKDMKKGQRSKFGSAPAPVEPGKKNSGAFLVEFLPSSGAIWQIVHGLVVPPGGQVTK